MADETKPQTPSETPLAEPASNGGQQTQQTFSADYVRELRQEAAKYRTKLSETEKTVSQALEKANARLISAEVRALQGYDIALLERLIDLSGVKVGDDGAVTGVKEAAEAAAKQFPAVLKAKYQPSKQWAPTNPAAGSSGTNPNQAMDDLIRRK
jgi:hypothetical protein